MTEKRFKVGAVSYLNTVPLIWGMLHGPQREQVQLSFAIPSACASEVERGTVDIGLVPVAEIPRQGLEIVPGAGIACLGAVRSILLLSRVRWKEVRTLAADLGSRTSVELARIILRERYGVEPQVVLHEPILDKMLLAADAALIIGDSALRITPEELPFECLDLGAEWLAQTGLPMVFAAWAGKPGISVESLQNITTGSYELGKARIDQIVEQEYRGRQISKQLADRYLREHIRFELGPNEHRGLQTFYELANLSPHPALAARR
ncbi:MAG: menaquinone biosynthetic enzyme MqnA/MqnD family protein [Bryobacteraceae bacterium]